MLARRAPQVAAVRRIARLVQAVSSGRPSVGHALCACRRTTTHLATVRPFSSAAPTSAAHSSPSVSSSPASPATSATAAADAWPDLPVMPVGSVLLAYLAQPGFLSALLSEIDAQPNEREHGLRTTVLRIHENLVLVRLDPSSGGAGGSAVEAGSLIQPLHAATVWLQPRLLTYRSISEAAKHLRRSGATDAASSGSVAPRWSAYAPLAGLHRRTALVLDDLPAVPKQLDENILFPLALPAPQQKQQQQQKSQLAATKAHSHAAERPFRAPSAFTLLSGSQLLYSTSTTSPFPNGRIEFVWDRRAPPSRAYLKLWEAFTRMQMDLVLQLGVQRGQAAWQQRRPQAGQVVVDLGSSPGGWTWAAQQMGATVVSVDRAPLSASISDLPRVHHFIASGFALEPHSDMLRPFLQAKGTAATAAAPVAAVPPADSPATNSASVLAHASADSPPPARIDWLLSDIICYPERALSLIRRWLDADAVEHGMVVTIKLQEQPRDDDEHAAPHASKGPAQQYHLALQEDVLRELRSVAHARLVHMGANKSEVTFLWLRPASNTRR